MRFPLLRYVLLTALLVFLAFHKLPDLFFGTDDFVNFAYMVQGKMGTEYAYILDSPRLLLFYQWFGLNPAPYYAVAVVFFFLSALAVGWIAYLLFLQTNAVFIATIAYIFSYAGVGSMYTISEAIRHTQYVTLYLITVACYFLVIRRQNILLYATTALLFGITTLFFPYRAHTLPIVLVLIEVFPMWPNVNLYRVAGRIIPFFVITFFVYAAALPMAQSLVIHKTIPFIVRQDNLSSLQTVSMRALTMIINEVRYNFLSKLALFFYLFIPNTLLPGKGLLATWLGKATWLHAVLFTAFMTTIFSFFSRERRRILLFLVLAILVTFLGFAFIYVDYQSSAHRYMFTVRPFFALLVAGLTSSHLSTLMRRLQFSKKIPALLIILTLAIVFGLQLREFFVYQKSELYYRGPFANQFFADIQKAIPSIPRYTLLFIGGDVHQLDRYRGMFRGVGTPGWVLVPYYGNNSDFYEFADNNHCQFFAQVMEKPEVDLYYFKITPEGLKQGNSRYAYLRCNMEVPTR